MPIFDHHHSIILKETFRFLQFVSANQKSVYSIYDFLRYSQFQNTATRVATHIFDQTTQYFSNRIYNKFGFHPQRSTEVACNLLVNDIRKNTDNSLLMGVKHLDLSEAFDIVSRLYPPSKLPSYEINENEFTWFEDYLSNRKQHVFYYGHLSKPFPVLRGVSQGSILGPTSFLLHLDDTDNCLHHSSIIKYADDTVIYVSKNDSGQIQKKLNGDTLEVHNWLTNNELSLNFKTAKTETMIFGTSTSIHVRKAAPLNIKIKRTSIN